MDKEGVLKGLIDLQDIREIMFDRDRYDSVTVQELMVVPDNMIVQSDKMDSVMSKFETSGAWNLPVVDSRRKIHRFCVSL